MTKQYLTNGLKARQREDGEDRALEFREKAREYGIKGRDIDFITKTHLVAITRSDSSEAMYRENYRAAIDRRRKRDGDDDFETKAANALGLIPVFVLYAPNYDNCWARGMNSSTKWYHMTLKEFFTRIQYI